jgi:hypothetical protein
VIDTQKPIGKLWDPWKAEQESLAPYQIREMHKRNGQALKGTTCKDCEFKVEKSNRTTRKLRCSEYSLDDGASSIWKDTFPACGKHMKKAKEGKR